MQLVDRRRLSRILGPGAVIAEVLHVVAGALESTERRLLSWRTRGIVFDPEAPARRRRRPRRIRRPIGLRHPTLRGLRPVRRRVVTHRQSPLWIEIPNSPHHIGTWAQRRWTAHGRP